jgi:hypothetical protein
MRRVWAEQRFTLYLYKGVPTWYTVLIYIIFTCVYRSYDIIKILFICKRESIIKSVFKIKFIAVYRVSQKYRLSVKVRHLEVL